MHVHNTHLYIYTAKKIIVIYQNLDRGCGAYIHDTFSHCAYIALLLSEKEANKCLILHTSIYMYGHMHIYYAFTHKSISLMLDY
jgi:hypothetical protein